jgi:hypothetical protein
VISFWNGLALSGTAVAYLSRLGIAATLESSYDERLARRAHPGKLCVGPLQGSSTEEGLMWGFLIGLYIVLIIYPFIEEWQQKRANKAALGRMRKHHALHHRWDVAKGQWSDE